MKICLQRHPSCLSVISPHMGRENATFPDQFPLTAGMVITWVHQYSISWKIAIFISLWSKLETRTGEAYERLESSSSLRSKLRHRPSSFYQLFPSTNDLQLKRSIWVKNKTWICCTGAGHNVTVVITVRENEEKGVMLKCWCVYVLHFPPSLSKLNIYLLKRFL